MSNVTRFDLFRCIDDCGCEMVTVKDGYYVTHDDYTDLEETNSALEEVVNTWVKATANAHNRINELENELNAQKAVASMDYQALKPKYDALLKEVEILREEYRRACDILVLEGIWNQ